MRCAYNEIALSNLKVVKESKTWLKHGLISSGQFDAIGKEFPSTLYHPNFIIRILIFIAALISLSGIEGLLVVPMFNSGKEAISIFCVVYGIGSFFFLEKIVMTRFHHYKSGVTEAVLYHSIGYVVGGITVLIPSQLTLILLFCFLVFSFSAFRYLDLLSTMAAVGTFSYLVFYELYEAGGVVRQIIPIVFIVLFTISYSLVRRLEKRRITDFWMDCLTVIGLLSLLLVYAAGNYGVVRELSVNLMQLNLQPGEDIPLAPLFYFLTLGIPVAYLYLGIRSKDALLLRVGLATLAFSVFTFHYYYSLGHPEFTLTAAGLILLGIALAFFKWLKKPRSGFTSENILSEKWASMNAEAFIISQTLGGNKIAGQVQDSQSPEGGTFGGGGASGDF